MSTPAGMPSLTPEVLFGEVRRNWGWLLALGVGSLILGTIGLGYLAAFTLVGVLFFGWLLFIGGAVELFQVFTCRGWKSRLLQLGIAAIHLAAGLVVIVDPMLASSFLTLLLAVLFVAGDISRIAVALHHRDHKGWGWVAFAGALAVLLGGMIALRWPESSFFVIGLFIAIELIVNGWGLVILALAARSSGGGPRAAGQPA